MKKAFTMLELVFVIVIIGILAATIIPNTRTNPLQEAALQIVSDIRYTQHLAMVDDKFNINDVNWSHQRWQILFSSNGSSGGEMAYTIFSDTSGDGSGNPDVAEIARNPANFSERMSGGQTSSVLLNIDNAGFVGMNKLNLGRSYGIDDVTFPNNSCSNGGSRRIAFDHIGRPIKGSLASNDTAYENYNLITDVNNCNIILTHTTGTTLTIRVHRETGYVCIIDDATANCI